MRLATLILCTVLTPLTFLAGLVVGAIAMMVLGLTLYGNYEYFAPGMETGLRGILGFLALCCGATVGAIAPWRIRLVRRKS